MAHPAEVAFSQLLAGGIGFMLLAGGALLVFLVMYQKRLLQEQLRRRTAEHQVLLSIIDAQEGERERIGQDLHDGVGATLATARLLVGRLGLLPASEDPAQLRARIEELLGMAVQDVRSVSHNLYPTLLARFGLAEALQHLVDVGQETGTLSIQLAVSYPRPLARTQELALYRICQELVHNALKHARGATQLRVRLEQRDSQLTLVVEDNGCGFPVAAPGVALPVANGVGLRSVEVRVELLQARLYQHSVPGQGVRTVIELDEPAQVH